MHAPIWWASRPALIRSRGERADGAFDREHPRVGGGTKIRIRIASSPKIREGEFDHLVGAAIHDSLDHVEREPVCTENLAKNI